MSTACTPGSASADPELKDRTDGSPVKLKITLKDGQVFEQRRDYATGSQRMPMTRAQLEEKFTDCAAQAVSPDVGRRILAFLNALPDRDSFGDFWTLIRSA